MYRKERHRVHTRLHVHMLKAFLRFYPRRMLAHGSRHYTYLVLRDNEIHVLLSRTAKRIHLKVIIPQECAAEECGANFYTVSPPTQKKKIVGKWLLKQKGGARGEKKK